MAKIRGWKVVGDTLYYVKGTDVRKMDVDYNHTYIGALTVDVDEYVAMEFNQVSLFIADGYDGWNLDIATDTLTEIEDFPGGYSLAFIKGFLLSEDVSTENKGKVWQSDLYDATTWDPLNFGVAEDKPDNAVRVHAQNDILYIFGETSIEGWYATGGEGFAFSPLGGASLNYGIAAPQSITPFKGYLTALVRSRGNIMVASLVGYELVPISRKEGRTSPMEAEWASYSRIDDAVATAYTVDGNSVYQITFPSARSNKGATWVLDAATMIWCEFTSGDENGRFIGDLAIEFDEKILMSDCDTGEIVQFLPFQHADRGTLFIDKLESDTIKEEGNYHNLNKLWLDCEVGVTSQEDTTQYLTVNVSPDGGFTWKPDRLVSIGKGEEYRARAIVRRLGRMLNGVIRITGTPDARMILADVGVDIE